LQDRDHGSTRSYLVSIVHSLAQQTDIQIQQRKQFRRDVLHGLRQKPKSIPCKYLYDDFGSRLFEQICDLDEYYPTRTELAIMRQHSPCIAERLGAGVQLIELGSGDSRKTRELLNHLALPVSYAPIDIACEALHTATSQLARAYPQVEFLPTCADFTADFELPRSECSLSHKVVYFPGSTIGNFERGEAVELLGRIAHLCGAGGGLLIGIDLKKEPRDIEAAYNDRRGVTAAFNLNVLRRINRELLANFRLDRFRHQAIYDPKRGRVELGLVSRCPQTATVAGERFEFRSGEVIRTEYSHKYSVEEFREMANGAGFTLADQWIDDECRFAVLYFTR
jgi:dimethylhistidine N-methyltransferase